MYEATKFLEHTENLRFHVKTKIQVNWEKSSIKVTYYLYPSLLKISAIPRTSVGIISKRAVARESVLGKGKVWLLLMQQEHLECKNEDNFIEMQIVQTSKFKQSKQTIIINMTQSPMPKGQ